MSSSTSWPRKDETQLLYALSFFLFFNSSSWDRHSVAAGSQLLKRQWLLHKYYISKQKDGLCRWGRGVMPRGNSGEDRKKDVNYHREQFTSITHVICEFSRLLLSLFLSLFVSLFLFFFIALFFDFCLTNHSKYLIVLFLFVEHSWTKICVTRICDKIIIFNNKMQKSLFHNFL